MTYLIIKNIHVLAAVLTICGFMLRGYWMMADSDKLQNRVTRIAPHIVDTVFLAAGIALLAILSLNPFLESWLVAKFAGLTAYILLGTIAIRRGSTKQIRTVALVAAVFVFAYVVGVALSKSPASWIKYLS